MTRRALRLSLFLLGLLWGPLVGAAAPLARGGPYEVRILLDNSGSMYPGYAPAGQGGAGLRAPYYRDDPAFRAWFEDFLGLQTVLDGGPVSLYAVTSRGGFQPSDVLRLSTTPRPSRAEASPFLDRLPALGNQTYLAESVREASQGFQGVLWLITDNVVERGAEEPNDGVRAYFRMLQGEGRYRSIHLFKLPAPSGADAMLAVYAIVVSDANVNPSDLSYLDRKLGETLRESQRPARAGALFPGREHLKLKDLDIDPVEFGGIKISFEGKGGGVYRGAQVVKLRVSGQVVSKLTQHTLTGGTITLRLVTPLVPDPGPDGKPLAEPIPAEAFEPVTIDLPAPIPPRGSRPLELEMVSRGKLSVQTIGARNWWRSAASGLEVTYKGTLEAQPRNLDLRYEPASMKGIFGIELAPEVFSFPAREIRHNPQASRALAGFTLTTGVGRNLLLVLLALLAAALVGLLAFLFLRKRLYRVKAGNQPERAIALRRLGRAEIVFGRHRLGLLTRDLLGGHELIPPEGNPAISIQPTAEEGRYHVSIRDEGSFLLLIEPWKARRPEGANGKGPSIPRPPGGASSPPSPTAAAPGPAPARPRPTIRRPGQSR